MNNLTFYTVTVETNGNNGFDSYRVPGIVTAANGDLLLCYEGRIQEGDRRTLFLRRSKDGGKTFTARTTIAIPKNGELLHNPLMIAGTGGEVWLFWCADYGRLFLRLSLDNGETFGPTKELTNVVDGFRDNWPVTLWSIAPGHGIQMKNGTIVLPLWLSKGEKAHLPAAFACIYSTDAGHSWRCSNVVPAGNNVGDPTEASVAECSDGTLLATMRHEIPGVRRRAFCSGGPEHWGIAYLNHTLPDPICSGALLTLYDGRMAFVNCAYGDEPALELQALGEKIRWSNDARQRLTLRVSNNDGASWSNGILLEQEAGASDLAQSLDGQTIYCFHEQGWQDGNCIFNKALVLNSVPIGLL